MFEQGKSGNPRGRPKGSRSGRAKALAQLDKVMARRKNQKFLDAAIEADFHANPMVFFKTVIMPLLPREARLSMETPGVINWKSLIGGQVKDGGDDAAPKSKSK